MYFPISGTVSCHFVGGTYLQLSITGSIKACKQPCQNLFETPFTLVGFGTHTKYTLNSKFNWDETRSQVAGLKRILDGRFRDLHAAECDYKSEVVSLG